MHGTVRDEWGVTSLHQGEGLVWKEMNTSCEGTIGTSVVQICLGGVRVV